MGREDKDKRVGLAIIFHSGAYDRVHHGLSIVMAALALGREVRLLFTHGALEYLRREPPPPGPQRARREQLNEFLRRAKRMGAEIYACAGSMASLNIARDELVEEVEASTGLAKFLMEAEMDQLLFI